MAEIRKVVCDVCQDLAKPAGRFRITKEGKGGNVDLCAKHAEPVEELLKIGRSRPRSGGRRSFDDFVTTLEDIEKQKAG